LDDINIYNQFCFDIPDVTDSERDNLSHQLDDLVWEARTANIEFDENIATDDWGFAGWGFQCMLRQNEETIGKSLEDTRYTFTLWGSGDINFDPIARFVQKFIAQNHPDVAWSAAWANTCNDFVPYAFGGGCIFITEDKIEYFSSSDWAAQKLAQHEQVRGK